MDNEVPADDFERQHFGAETIILTDRPPSDVGGHVGLFDARTVRAALQPYASDPDDQEAHRRSLWEKYGLDPARPYRVFRNIGSPRYYVFQSAALI